ncbi:site-specific integrase [Ginsengibacter hankyongi]|uniref:Site-specific integrase n=1 Tax=Ginsengibacter hankyongi TaxID=2607284 RepID=A0A5J5INW0_9BACT|nr:site-specific integrase [Ginsengibacter hankyongi]KAA9041624.1 site-specific integrase [Ginsengibacter hankyongi]
MGTIRFVLRTDKPDKEGFSPIQMVYQLGGVRNPVNEKYEHKRKYFTTGKKLHPVNWDNDSQQAISRERSYIKKATKEGNISNFNFDLLPSSNDIKDINSELASFCRDVADIEKRFKLNRVIYSAEMVIEELKDSRLPTTKKKAPTNQVFDFIEKYIEDNKLSREAGSMSVYKSLKNHLQNYQIEKKRRVAFDEIDLSFFMDFQNYLIKSKSKRAPNGLGNVTIAKQLSTLKTFLNYARMHGITVSDSYKDFKIKKESLEVIALTNEEFETLYNFDLSKNKKLDQVRDVFCFSCATGLRYSDLAQLKREHIKKDEIRLIVTKTKQQSSIPLNPFSHSILEKYSKMLRPLPVISNQKMNDYLKDLCKLAEINEPVQIVRFRGAKREENSYPKYELISVHTGRKTFCTLSLEKGMSAEEVMKISGHKDYASFSRYVKITEQRSKIVMRNAWGEIRKPKLKAV